MLDYGATLLAALIGALIGSVGAVIVEHWLSQRAEYARRREVLVQQYLFQVQDSVETLWHRLKNLTSRDGRFTFSDTSDTYFEITTLYALGRVLACERILALEGVYPEIDALYPKLGEFLRQHQFDEELEAIHFHKYDRISLAESIIEREGDRFRISTYLEFRRRYEAEVSPERNWLTQAKEAIESEYFDEARMKKYLDFLLLIETRIAEQTSAEKTKTQFELPQGLGGTFALVLMNRVYRPIYENLARVLDLNTSDNLLEIACGNGHFIKNYTSHINSVDGLDLSELCIKLAKKKNKERIAEKTVKFVQGDATRLPWEDNTFSVTTSMVSFMIFPRPLESLKEMYRVLKLGGRAVVSVEWNAEDGKDHSRAVKKYGIHLWTEDDVRNMFEEAGFSNINISYAKGFIAPKVMIARGFKPQESGKKQ